MTPEQRRKIIMQDPRMVSYHESGDSERAARCMAASYIIHSVANEYSDEAMECIERHGLNHKRFKTRAVNLQSAFELYHKEFSDVICDHDAKSALCDDYEAFRRICQNFMNASEVENVYVNMSTGMVVDKDDPEATPCIVCSRKKGNKE